MSKRFDTHDHANTRLCNRGTHAHANGFPSAPHCVMADNAPIHGQEAFLGAAQRKGFRVEGSGLRVQGVSTSAQLSAKAVSTITPDTCSKRLCACNQTYVCMYVYMYI